MISLIIPTLNEVDVLGKTLADLEGEIKDKYKVEVIISDVGSTDGTQELAVSLGAKVVGPQFGAKQNIATGRNTGAKAAQGEVLVFLDADTIPHNWSELFKAAQALLQDSKVVAAAPRIAIAPDQRRWQDIFWLNFYNIIIFAQNFLGLGYGRGNCQIIKKTVFQKVGGYNEELPAAEDFDLYRRLSKLGRVKNLWQVVAYESPRRYRSYGYLKVNWLYFMNSLSLIWRGRAWSKRWPRVK